MKKHTIGIGIVVIASILLVGCTGVDLEDWSWELTAPDQQTITIPQEAIDAVGSTDVEDVFASIMGDPDLLIFIHLPNQSPAYQSWSQHKDDIGFPQTLTVCVGADYTISLSSPDTLIIPYN